MKALGTQTEENSELWTEPRMVMSTIINPRYPPFETETDKLWNTDEKSFLSGQDSNIEL